LSPSGRELRAIAVVGGSLAGLRAVEGLRRRGFTGRILWVGEEARDPYDRPPLSKQVLDGRWEPERVVFRRDTGYDALGVERYFGRRATRLDSAARVLHLDDGTTLSWDGLIIATGAAPRTLPGTAHLGGVFTLRTLDDAVRLRAAVQEAARVVVVGAGFIGLEVASSCRRLGCAVTVLEALPVPLGGAIGEEMGRALAILHGQEGVDLRTGARVRSLSGTDRVGGVVLESGEILPTDVVVVGIGVRPSTDWLHDSGVLVEDGVLCDERLCTSVPDIVAAGDVARWPHPLFDERLRVEHWTNAVEQANAAVARLLDGPEVEPFASVPYFWSDQYDVKIQFAGRYAPGDDVLLAEGHPEHRRAVVLYGRGGRLTGILALGHPAALVKYRRRIAERAPLAPA
jgi:3-phenylpropionate/trans-cinnamate dioxygenase ferredoxin reductase component